ncbi:ribonuclease G [Comamonas thiooxydans]|uniref:Ribonuclease G n=1 Tax=Comamonas thiooxydans TaxID=363952 RepID=A0AA42Q0S3_9BURK|nr:ribonuclease G [Comamonas thiooxydans]MDH1335173.1 ribonuclease G [Comamonas thiooxydans]MDH1475693.1 ribonuclease G [Comamonas thiooxydans]MDH1740651.1 ribonuclease G [Comamonas thiooxydans]MDH1786873.1 ribonuclease G [Comamonas thiooxydans]
MQQDILINWSPQETRVAIVENGAVQELHMERPLERGLVGNIYLGKVSRVLPGMQSAFIDIGLERAAFLHVADVWQRQESGEAPMFARKDQPLTPIEKQVFEGQSIMVQVIKDPIGTKGARLSTQISIAGRLLVFLPQDDHIGISQKIPQNERDALRARLQELVGTKEGGGGGGFILRTNGEESSDAELADDIRYLRKTWARIKDAAQKLPVMSVLHQDLNLLQRVLRDLVGENTQSIRIDSREQFALLKSFGQEYMPAAVPKLALYKGERPIFDLYNIDEEIARALGRRVDLKSGGYLIVDQTEALTTIDVNTGGYVGARNFDDTIFKTNLEAAHAIARQLRLRNLGGIVIVDFIDMVREEHQGEVLSEFRRQLARDRVKTMAGGFSQLGLVEMTRKRTRESLAHMLCEPCEACSGKGNVKTARSICYEVLREILREARQFNPHEFRVVASPKVVEMFLDEESQHLASLSDFIGKPISLQAETAMAQEQYDIVLL